MAARPGGKGPTLYEVAGWIQGVVAAVFRTLGIPWRFLLGKDLPPWLATLGDILLVLAAALFFYTAYVAINDGTAEGFAVLRNGLFVAGIAAGVPFLIWRTILASRQTDINQQTHFTDLYTKAVELLGADKVVKERVEISPAIEGKPAVWETAETTVPNIEVRLGAIYALQRIMNQSDDDYLPILKTLCVYVRTYVDKPEHLFFENDSFGGRERTDEDDYHAEEAIDYLQYNAKFGNPNAFARPDIRAALDVITQRRAGPKFINFMPDLSHVNLQGNHLPNYNFSCINFKSARLEGAYFSSAFFKNAILAFAELRGADLSGADLRSANLFRADLIDSILLDAQLDGALLAGAILPVVEGLTYEQLASAFGDAATILPHDLEAMRPRLISETGWAKDKIPLLELHQRWAAWRTARNL